MRELVRRPPPPFAAELARARGPAGAQCVPHVGPLRPHRKNPPPPPAPLFADASVVLANETVPP